MYQNDIVYGEIVKSKAEVSMHEMENNFEIDEIKFLGAMYYDEIIVSQNKIEYCFYNGNQVTILLEYANWDEFLAM